MTKTRCGARSGAEVIARTHAAGVEEVVVKRGADSCLVAIAGQPLREVPAVSCRKRKWLIPRRRAIRSAPATWLYA